MMRSTSAYPPMSNRQCFKYTAIVMAAVLLLFAIFTGDGEEGSLSVGSSFLRSEGITSAKLSELIGVGLGLTEQAAEEIKKVKSAHAEDLKVKGHTKEGIAEPVTVADTNSNLVFVNGYRNHFSGVHILSEETEPDKADIKVGNPTLPGDFQLEMDPNLDMKDVLIIIDPLDATKEFGEDLLNYVTTMVCIVYKGEPIAGIINQVFEDEKPPVVGVIPLKPEGKGLLFNRVKKTAEGEAAHKVAISRSHTGEGGNVVEKYLEGHSPLLAGGAGYKALLVVDGETEGYVHVTAIKSWDVCAAQAVMKASGGDFTDIEGHSLEYPMEYDSDHSQAVFKNGIVATQTQEQHKYFVSKLGGHLE